MSFLLDLLAALAFQERALRALASRRSVLGGYLILGAGFLTLSLVRSLVYAEAEEVSPVRAGIIGSFFHLNLVQAILFLALIYIPAIICLSNAFAGDGLGFSFSRDEYQIHVSALFPLWGVLFLEATLLTWLAPGVLELGRFEIGFGLLALALIMVVYTVWAIKKINYISAPVAFAVFFLSWFTLPLFFVLTMFLFALPFFIMIPVAYMAFQRFRGYFAARTGERDFQEHLRSLTVNAQDADAHHQLGLIHLRRRNFDAARSYFENALKIDPNDPDYHYYLGRAFEEKEDWTRALEQYEETYRLKPEYGLRDIFREVGKGYLHTGRLDKAVEFLQFFLEFRTSDPEGRYWLAVAMKKLGKTDEMRAHLATLLNQARSNPRFFRKENRRWLYQARILQRQS